MVHQQQSQVNLLLDMYIREGPTCPEINITNTYSPYIIVIYLFTIYILIYSPIIGHTSMYVLQYALTD